MNIDDKDWEILMKEMKRLYKLEWSAREILRQYQKPEQFYLGEYPDTFEAGYQYALNELKTQKLRKKTDEIK